MRAEDTVGRLAGDEFAIVLNRLNALDDAARVARKVVEEMSRPIEVDSNELRVSASVGISIFPTDADDDEGLVRNADRAMYCAKQLGRNNFQFYGRPAEPDS